MIRRIIEIDQKNATAAGSALLPVTRGAIGMVDGKAALLKDDYCDGLGDCLPACPTGAISFVEREAAAYDEAAVQVHMAARKGKTGAGKCKYCCFCKRFRPPCIQRMSRIHEPFPEAH